MTASFLQAPLLQLLLLLLMVARLHMSFDQAADIEAAVRIQVQAPIVREVFNSIKVIQQAAAGGSGALIGQPEPWPGHPSELR